MEWEGGGSGGEVRTEVYRGRAVRVGRGSGRGFPGTTIAPQVRVKRPRSLQSRTAGGASCSVLLFALHALVGLTALHAQPAKSASAASSRGKFDAGKVNFSVSVGGIESTYRVFGFYILPGSSVEVEARSPGDGGDGGSFRLEAGLHTQSLGAVGIARWRFVAPGARPSRRWCGRGAGSVNIFVRASRRP